jgi:hypothetical protein
MTEEDGATGQQQNRDGEGSELHSLTSKGLDSYHRLVPWIGETMKGMKI